VRAWQKRLGARKGIFCEPSSAVAPAALADLLENGCIGGHDVVVVISGSGFREIGVLQSEPVTKLGADALAEDLDHALTSS
jgi:threonine synthase